MGRWGDGEIFYKGTSTYFFTYKFLKICIKIHNDFRDNSPHFSLFPTPDSRFPIPDSRFPIPDSRFPL
ncbi:hypothetical protein [Moorena sp. SIO3H5]|uniref:hypothetical protein n=1 Tax=Moorena sp. SIO3H5 TaxID=2607834 RepID=UPI0013BDF0DD|nr:hypothetical protein [Moorena sp. SIO3H5]NEO74613.1 hypothetical protein [Moorena sp. SIO3H5]